MAAAVGPIHDCFTVTAEGVSTDIIQVAYSDKVFLAITQNGKLGALVDCSANSTPEGGQFAAKVLLGDRDDELMPIFARHIAGAVAKRTKKPLLLSLALLNKTPDTMQAILEAISKRQVWA